LRFPSKRARVDKIGSSGKGFANGFS
jgi:hypothetical protein